MPQEQSELQKLFKRPDNEVFGSQQESTVETQEELPEDLKNRHIRRLETKLQSEREASIAREARIEALTEAQKFRKESGVDDLDEMVARIYGTDKPENAAATELLTKAMKGYSERAKREAIEELRTELQNSRAEEQRETQAVQSYIEQIEDKYGIDFTSTAAGREKQQQFRDLWFRLSPKDSGGEVKEYADPYEVYEIFSQSQGGSRAKELSARGMVRSAPVQTSVQDDATTKYLRENGIIDPF